MTRLLREQIVANFGIKMAGLKLVDLSSRLDTDEVHELLLALGYPADVAPAKAQRIVAEYQNTPEQPILGGERDGLLLGLIGLRMEDETRARIRHLVVHPRHRRSGVGGAMIRAVCEKFLLHTLSAETDRDAVDFYRRCGFEVVSLGELYPGTERFQCLLELRRSA